MRADEVRVELVESRTGPEAAAEEAAWSALLSDDERARAVRLRGEAARRTFVAAHALARRALGRAAGVSPERLVFRAGARGKPEIDAPARARDLRFNLSHSAGIAACALARGVDVGVDVEAGERLRDPLALAARFFAAREVEALRALPEPALRARFLELWVLKEALLKARGAGVAGGLDRVTFEIADGRPQLALAAGEPDAASDWQLALWRPTPRHHLALALRRGARPDLVLTLVAPSAR